MSDWKNLLNKKILIVAAILSMIGSVGYAHYGHSLWTQLSYLGLPGILVSAALSIALLGSHGGGPLGMLLVIATPINFLLYVALGMAAQKLAALFNNPNGKPT